MDAKEKPEEEVKPAEPVMNPPVMFYGRPMKVGDRVVVGFAMLEVACWVQTKVGWLIGVRGIKSQDEPRLVPRQMVRRLR